MSKVSIIIPSRNEFFLQKTIDNIFQQARGDVEVIAYLDGVWPDPQIRENPRLKLIHPSESKGMREGINSSVGIATGEYIMKLDGHCCLSEGFDEVLKESCKDDWLVVPRRYDLDGETFTRGNKRTDYMYLSAPLKKPEGFNGDDWERGFHGVRWNEKNRDEKLLNIEIDDLMSFQGSCYFMKKEYFQNLGGLEIGRWGWFAQEAQEIGNKVWLSGGRCIRNKKCWYAHLHKGKTYGRGYYISRRENIYSAKSSINIWMNNKWEKSKHDIKWLIDKFSPVPTWEKFDWGKFEWNMED